MTGSTLRSPAREGLVTANIVLTTSYAVAGIAKNLAGYGDLTLHAKATDATNATVLEVYVEDDPAVTTAPTAIAGMRLLRKEDGSVLEITIAAAAGGLDVAVPLKCSGNWFLVRAKSLVAATTLNEVYISGNVANT